MPGVFNPSLINPAAVAESATRFSASLSHHLDHSSTDLRMPEDFLASANFWMTVVPDLCYQEEQFL
jgi:uncharacterized membrane protein YcfT